MAMFARNLKRSSVLGKVSRSSVTAYDNCHQRTGPLINERINARLSPEMSRLCSLHFWRCL